MTEHPRELRYTIEHEWVRVEDDGTATIGVTFFAQDQLGDVVYVVLPAVGSTVQKDSKMGEIESVKSVSDLFVPVSGEVIETNQDVIDHPERVNEDPHGAGWMVRVRMSDPSEVDGLLTNEQYDSAIAT
ncbi:MAG: glycine cleavage system protein GcvH [Chloroflexota bacterium]|nr:glycine cleavage system protein GcvH [Chloroflexota bacterium]MDE2969984.1 glycine cleavage system protein GcvH [Chloroflexota bacterium]